MLNFYPSIDVGKITIRNYNSLLSQAFNIVSWKSGGKIELETNEDKQARAENEFAELIRKGKWE